MYLFESETTLTCTIGMRQLVSFFTRNQHNSKDLDEVTHNSQLLRDLQSALCRYMHEQAMKAHAIARDWSAHTRVCRS